MRVTDAEFVKGFIRLCDDGFKDIPADRTAPRARLKDSLDQILSIDYDKSKV